jgi:hypothetical protein
MPEALPTTVAIAANRPQAIALAMVNKTDGPGAKMIKMVAIKYSQSRLGIAFSINIPK